VAESTMELSFPTSDQYLLRYKSLRNELFEIIRSIIATRSENQSWQCWKLWWMLSHLFVDSGISSWMFHNTNTYDKYLVLTHVSDFVVTCHNPTLHWWPQEVGSWNALITFVVLFRFVQFQFIMKGKVFSFWIMFDSLYSHFNFNFIFWLAKTPFQCFSWSKSYIATYR
jgi:hypothetical protein